MPIQALIFDFDGLILETELPDYQAWQEIYAEYGCSVPFLEWSSSIGTRADAFDPHEYLEGQVGRRLDRDAIALKRRDRYHEMVRLLPVSPGVIDLIHSARNRGLKVAVASSASHGWVDGHLERLRILPYVDCIRCREDVTSVKPDPALYQAVLRQFDLVPSEAIAFEDSPNGVAAAKAAGIFCVAVPNVMTRDLPLNHADLLVRSLADITLDDLIEHSDEK